LIEEPYGDGNLGGIMGRLRAALASDPVALFRSS
jgi:hypothetical protein